MSDIKEKPVVKVSCAKTNSLAKNFKENCFFNIPAKIIADDPDFIPFYENDCSYALLRAQLEDNIVLTTGSCVLVSVGFALDLSKGYRAVITVAEELLTKGIFLVNAPKIIDFSNKEKISINVYNLGEEVVLKPKDIIAKIIVEPVYYLDWQNIV